MLLFIVLIRTVSFLGVFRPALRHVIATLPLRRPLGIAKSLITVVARTALHGHDSLLLTFDFELRRQCVATYWAYAATVASRLALHR